MYENNWGAWPDDRFDGLLEVANAINDAHDLASGETGVVARSELAPSVHLILTPLRLAELMHEAANRIRDLTAS